MQVVCNIQAERDILLQKYEHALLQDQLLTCGIKINVFKKETI